MNGRPLRMTLLNLSMHGKEADLRIGAPEILRGAFAGEQFDVVLSNPPFGIMLPGRYRTGHVAIRGADQARRGLRVAPTRGTQAEAGWTRRCPHAERNVVHRWTERGNPAQDD